MSSGMQVRLLSRAQVYDPKQKDRERADEKRRVLAEYKITVGCADCDYNGHHSALEFDHLPGQTKLHNVAGLCYRSWEVIWAEVAKCEVVCANCHATRTWKRNNNEA